VSAGRFATVTDRRYNIEYVQGPAALGDGNIFQRFNAAELRAHFFRRNDDGGSRPVLRSSTAEGGRESALTFPAFSRKNWSGLTSAATSDNNGNPRLDRDAIQGEITANPAGTAGRG
jgi:hypothetical protein